MTDLHSEIESSCGAVCVVVCVTRSKGCDFLELFPRHQPTSTPRSLYKWAVWWHFGDQSDLKRTERERRGKCEETDLYLLCPQ